MARRHEGHQLGHVTASREGGGAESLSDRRPEAEAILGGRRGQRIDEQFGWVQPPLNEQWRPDGSAYVPRPERLATGEV